MIKVFAGILLFFAAAFLGLQLAVSQGTERFLGIATQRLLSSGIRADLDVERARFSLPCSVTWSRAAADLRLGPSGPLGSRVAGLNTSAEKVRVAPARWSSSQWTVSVDRAVITVEPRSGEDRVKPGRATEPGLQTLYLKHLEMPVTLNVLDPQRTRQDLSVFLGDIEEFAKNGSTPVDIRFEGKFLTSIGGQKGELRFKSVRKDGLTTLELDRDEIKKIGDLTEEGLTDAEVEVLMTHPAKAPKLLEIQRYASDKARKLGRTTRGFPSDAYRHVLWNYLLTKEYGSEFTLLLTNAHETGENKTADDPRDHAMDLNNNRVGIGYALMGLDESEIQWKIVSDPRIIRSRDEVTPQAAV